MSNDGNGSGSFGSAAAAFSDYTTAQLSAEEKRRTSLENRGVSIIGVSGTLVTLLFGFVSFSTKSLNFHLPTNAKPWLITKFITFGLSALVAIVTLAPLSYWVPTTDGLRTKFTQCWLIPVADAQKITTANKLAELEVAQRINNIKAWFLVVAIAAQAVAISLLAISLVSILGSQR